MDGLLAEVGEGVPIPDCSFTVNTDGSITATIPMSPEDVARGAAFLYEDGQSHEEVTAWLESRIPRFREVLIECLEVGVENKKRWVLAIDATIVTATF